LSLGCGSSTEPTDNGNHDAGGNDGMGEGDGGHDEADIGSGDTGPGGTKASDGGAGEAATDANDDAATRGASDAATRDAGIVNDGSSGATHDGSSETPDAGEGDAHDDAAVDAGSQADAEGADAGDTLCDGQTFPASNATGSRVPAMGFGWVELTTAAQNQLVGLDTTLVVPTKPPASGTLFLWPGIQPDGPGSMDLPINNGVLQPVLTWGPTCAPNAPSGSPYASWWISAQYVNTNLAMTSPEFAMYGGCHGGPGMDAAVGDSLKISMTLSGENWTQTVTDAQSGQSVSYAIDMMNQVQDIGEFVIEGDSQEPVSDVIFMSTTLTFASSQPAACQPQFRGTNDYFSAPQASTDGLHCCIQKIILRAQGVAATSPDTP
jgi:hypothetical protein